MSSIKQAKPYGALKSISFHPIIDFVAEDRKSQCRLEKIVSTAFLVSTFVRLKAVTLLSKA
jgi:hypothetical protein